MTEDRGSAVRSADASLLRPGSPLVEAIRLQQEWDDRAQTAAMWHAAPGIVDDVLGIRCDLLIRADPSAAFNTWAELEAQRPRTAQATRTDADAPLAVAAIQRRVDAYLPPASISLWFNESAEEIVDPEILDLLEAAMTDAVPDPSWDEARWVDLTQRLGLISIADLMVDIGPRAREAALDRSGAAGRAAVAAERATRDWEDIERVLALRAEVSLDAKSAERDLEAEQQVSRVLIEAIRSPVAHWSGACLLMLTPEAG